MSARACILFMVRAPRPGRVKTRLAAEVGDAAAARLYRAFAEDMLESLDGCGADIAVWVDPAGDLDMVRGWLGRERPYLAQPEGDLGARMDHAFRWAFASGYGAAACLGSDLPLLSPSMARNLARLTRGEPALIGPSPDGGYWTIGFSAATYLPAVFEGMPWSTPEVYGLTMRALAGLEPAELPELADMDTLADVKALVLSPPPDAARRTVAALRALEIG